MGAPFFPQAWGQKALCIPEVYASLPTLNAAPDSVETDENPLVFCSLSLDHDTRAFDSPMSIQESWLMYEQAPGENGPSVVMEK